MEKSKLLTELESMPLVERESFLDAPFYLAKQKNAKQLKKLLIDFTFIDAKVQLGHLPSLIADYDLAEPFFQKPSLPTIQSALRLSSDILDKDTDQLAPQLWARLNGQQASSIQKLLHQTALAQDVWLCPTIASLADKTQSAVYSEHSTPGNDGVLAMTTSQDSKILVSGNTAGQLCAWDIATGQKLFDFDSLDNENVHGGILSIFIRKHERVGYVVISGCMLGNVAHWSLESGELIDLYRSDRRPFDEQATTFDILGKGSFFALGFENGTIEMFRRVELERSAANDQQKPFCTQQIEIISALDEPASSVRSIAFSPTAPTMHVSLYDSYVTLCLSKQHQRMLPVNRQEFGACSEMLYRHRFFIVSDFNSTKVLDMYTDEDKIKTLDPEPHKVKSFKLEHHGSIPSCIEVSPLEEYLVVAFRSGELKIASLRDSQEIQTFNADQDGLVSAAITVDGRRCITSSLERIRFWNIQKGELIQTALESSPVNGSVDVSTDGRYALTVDKSKGIQLWSSRNGLKLQEHYNIDAVSTTGMAHFSPISSRVVWYDMVYGFVVWNVELRQMQARIPLDESFFVQNFSISGDEKWIIVSGYDLSDRETKEIQLIHLVGAEVVPTRHTQIRSKLLSYKGSLVKEIAPLHNSSAFFSLSNDNQVYFWDPVNGKERILLESYKNIIVSAIKASRHEDCLVVACKDEYYGLSWVDSWKYDFSTQSWQKRRLLFDPIYKPPELSPINQTRIDDVDLSSDGRLLITCYGDCSLRVWNIQTQQLIAKFIGTHRFDMCAITSDDRNIILVENIGKTHILRLHTSDTDDY